MADWNQPSLSDGYSDFQTRLKNRDLDAMTLMNADGTNIPENAIKYLRASNKFQERLSGAWVDKILSLAGGGTGAATAADARTNFGLGTIATQNANNVNITGGSITGITFSLPASSITSGNFDIARMPLGGTWSLTSLLTLSGHSSFLNGIGFGYTSVSSNHTLTAAETFLLVDSTGATRTISLPAAVTGKVYVIYKNASANLVTIDPNGSEQLRTSYGTDFTTYDLTRFGESITLIGHAGFGWLEFGGSAMQVADIFHGDISYGSGETGDKTTTITWEGGDPTATDQIDLIVHGPHQVGASDTSQWAISARVTSTTQITFKKENIPIGGVGSPSADPSTHYFTAKKYRGVS